MTLTVRMVHSDTTRDVELTDGQTIADALVMIGYPKTGHESWRAWIRGWPVSLNMAVRPGNTTVTVTHRAAGHP